MKKINYKIIVGLYLRGVDLEPSIVSKKLGVNPTHSQRKGERKVTSTNRECVAKIGMWGLIADSNTYVLSDHINRLASQVGARTMLHTIENVQEAYVDIFIAASADEDGEATCEFALSEEDIAALNQFHLPIRFTVTLVKDGQ